MVDPKAKKYKRWSSYNYILNNPIINVDPKGDTVQVTITSNEIGKDYIRIVASESFGLDYNQETNLYQMTISDDVSFTVSEYSVTHNSPKAAQDPEGTFAGNDKNAYRVDNLAFEPKSSVGEYQGVMRTDGKAGGRLEL